MRVLVVEDQEELAAAVAGRLRERGYAVDVATDGGEADERLRRESYHLVVLDLILPGLGGEAVLQGLRRRRSMTPVLVLTARSEVEDKVGILDLGADDCLVKPFDFRELEARCRALLRRPHGTAASATRFGNLVFDAAARRVTVAGRPVGLTGREFRLLELLLANLGRVLGKDVLLDRLSGREAAAGPNAIELCVSRLRRKLDGATVHVHTLRGTGYVAEVASRQGRPGPEAEPGGSPLVGLG
jgi:two-component system, OmpR family, response regulator TctD